MGRRTLLREKTLEDICNASGDIVKSFLEDKSIPKEKKIRIARDIVLKRVPTDSNVDLQGSLSLTDLMKALGDEKE